MKYRIKVYCIIIALLCSVSITSCNSISHNYKKDINTNDIKNNDVVSSKKTNEDKDVLDELSLEEKLNLMMMISINDTSLSNETSEFIEKYRPGGIILFKNNIISKDSTSELIKSIRNKYAPHSRKVLIGVDEEGGSVNRFPESEGYFSSAGEIGKSGDYQKAYDAGNCIGKKLKEYGFDIDFAPVVDVNTNPNNPIIGDRAFSSNPNEVLAYAESFMKGLHENGIISCIKHFPGHGDTSVDSHNSLPVINHDLERLQRVELYPFKKIIEDNKGMDQGMVLVGHISVPTLDNSGVPASLSKKIITNTLKEQLGFKGVVITDAMNMGALSQDGDYITKAREAILAGADIVLMPYDGDITKKTEYYENLITSLNRSVNIGEIPMSRINDAVKRILNLQLVF